MTARIPWVAALLAGGCVVTPSTKSDTGTTGHTGGATTGACPAGIAALDVFVCVESTAAPTPPTTTSGPLEVAVTATVTEVGGALAAVPGSAAVESFDACEAEHTQQVRLIDGAGATWTVGWGLADSALAAGSADAVAVSDVLDLYVRSEWFAYSVARAVLLSDVAGPRFLYEIAGYAPVLSTEQRGQVAVEIHPDDTCVQGDREHYRVTVSGPAAQVELRSGQRTTVALPDRDLDFTLANSSWLLSCDDGCGGSEWTAWETP